MATINQILNKIKDMAARTGLFAIGKNEFFDTLTDITNKMSEINDNVNSVAKSLVWQDPVVNIVGTLPSSGLTIGQRYVLTTDSKIYTATSTTQFDAGTTPEAGWAVKNQNDGYIHSYNGAVWKNTGLTAFPEEVVLSSVQVLTDVQKLQVRENIGAFANNNVVDEFGNDPTKVINQKKVTEIKVDIGSVLGSDITKTIISTTIQRDNYYINGSTNAIVALSGYAITNPVSVVKGDIIFVDSELNTTISAISKTDVTGASYQNLVLGVINTKMIRSYICEFDGYIAFCYYKTSGINVYKINSLLAGQIQEVDKTKLPLKLDKTEFDQAKADIALTNITPTFVANVGEIDKYGVVNTGSTGYRFTSPIQLKAGQKIKCYVHGTNISHISLTDSNGSYYIPLVLSVGGGVYNWFEYLAISDCYVALSTIGTTFNATILSFKTREDIAEIKPVNDIIATYAEKEINYGSMLSLSKLDDSNPPAVPAIGSTWDWQNAYTSPEYGTQTYYTAEIQTRLILLKPGIYKYTGRCSGSAGFCFYDKKAKFKRGIMAKTITGEQSTPLDVFVFVVNSDTPYVSFNCYKTHVISGAFSLKRLAAFNPSNKFIGTMPQITGVQFDETAGAFSIPVPSMSFGMSFTARYLNNLCNTSGTLTLMKFIGGVNTYEVKLSYSPASDVLLPQKENTANESNIYFPNFPMAVMQSELQFIKNGTLVTSLKLDGKPYRTLLRQVPAMTIRYIKKETDVLSTLTDLKLFVDQTDGVCDLLTIQKGETTLFSYVIDNTKDIYFIYKELQSGLAAIEGYDFELTFSDIEGMKVEDLVATKADGLKFVTAYSDNCLTTGNVVYDTYPVFIEAMDRAPRKYSVNLSGEYLNVYCDNALLFRQIVKKIDTVQFGFEGVEIIEAEAGDKYTENCNPIVKAYTAHSFYNSPTHPTSYTDPDKPNLHNPVGFVSMLKKHHDDRGYVNVSAEDVAMHILRGDKLPEKCYFVEVDDLATLDGFKKMLSDTDPDGLRIMEILKLSGIKMGFAMEFYQDNSLFLKIENGTATEQEKSTLSLSFTNAQIQKLRCMMHTYGWTVAIHTLIYPSQNVTNISFDNFVSSVRNTIKWYERMFLKTPLTYVTSGTGNSSPYFRRLFPMYGIPIVVQDGTGIYSTGSKFLSYNSRDYTGTRYGMPVPDNDY